MKTYENVIEHTRRCRTGLRHHKMTVHYIVQCIIDTLISTPMTITSQSARLKKKRIQVGGNCLILALTQINTYCTSEFNIYFKTTDRSKNRLQN